MNELLCDVAVVGAGPAGLAAATAAKKQGAKRVVVTLGSKGVLYKDLDAEPVVIGPFTAVSEIPDGSLDFTISLY